MTVPPPYPHRPPEGPVDEPATGPLPMVGGTTGRSEHRSLHPQTPILLTVIGVLVLALGVMTALWVSANNQLSAIAAEQEAVPDLKAVADKHFSGVTTVRGNSDSVSITISGYDIVDAEPALEAVLDELGFSPAVLDRMEKTRALDGTLEASGHNCNVTWTYHPDDGLQMVFEAVHPS